MSASNRVTRADAYIRYTLVHSVQRPNVRAGDRHHDSCVRLEVRPIGISISALLDLADALLNANPPPLYTAKHPRGDGRPSA